MSRKKKITEKALQFIIKKMSEGEVLTKICEKYPDEVGVSYSTLNRASTEDPHITERLNHAYTLWYLAKRDELDRLSSGLASELFPGVDFREAEAALKRRIDALKFELGKMAPTMSKRFDRTVKVEVENNGPQIQVLNYYAAPTNLIESDT